MPPPISQCGLYSQRDYLRRLDTGPAPARGWQWRPTVTRTCQTGSVLRPQPGQGDVGAEGWRGRVSSHSSEGAPAPAHLLSPRESVVEAGHVSHDGFLIWPQSAYNICAEREKERERQERVKDAGRVAEARGSCGRNSACSGLEARPWLRPGWACLAEVL